MGGVQDTLRLHKHRMFLMELSFRLVTENARHGLVKVRGIHRKSHACLSQAVRYAGERHFWVVVVFTQLVLESFSQTAPCFYRSERLWPSSARSQPRFLFLTHTTRSPRPKK